MRVALDVLAQRGNLRKRAAKRDGAHLPGRSRAMNEREQGRGGDAERDRHAVDTFASDDRNLQPALLAHRHHQRDRAPRGKVDVAYRLSRLGQDLAEGKIDLLAAGEHARAILRWQALEKSIGDGRKGRGT